MVTLFLKSIRVSNTVNNNRQQIRCFFCVSVECLRTIWALVVSLTLRRKHFSLTGKFLRWSNAAGCQMLVGSNEMHHTRYKNRYFRMPHVPIIACCIHLTCGGVPFHESVHCIAAVYCIPRIVRENLVIKKLWKQNSRNVDCWSLFLVTNHLQKTSVRNIIEVIFNGLLQS